MKTAMTGAVVVAGGLLAWTQLSSPAADVPLLATPAWQGKAAAYGEQLLLRRDAQADRVLLLKHSAHDGAYRYDGRTRSLAAVAEQDWTRAGGPIAECGTQIPPSPQVLRIDPHSHKLIAGERDVPTAGATVLSLTESPSHRYAAVLSAMGPAKPSLVPFLGGGAAEGQRVHQLMSLPAIAPAGPVVRIPVQRSDEVLAACWSLDEKAVVYHDVLFTHVSVIEL
jgi:hypothetical protein